MVPFAGWEMPVQYLGVTKEHAAVRTRAGLFDVSHMGELWLEGPGAADAVDRLVTNHVGGLADGKALYTACCAADGGILDDLIVYRLSAERVLVVCNASNRSKIVGHFGDALGVQTAATGPVVLEDRSATTALLALQGPVAATILDALGAHTATALPRFSVAQCDVAGVSVLAARTGYTGEDGFELFCASDRAGQLWDALLQAGEPHGLMPIGLGARDTLRLEAALMLYGNDIDGTTNPYEAGLGWVVKTGRGDFIGREALVAIKAAGVTRKLVGFEVKGRGIARHGYPILDADGQAVGNVTSGAPSLSLGTRVGLGYVPVALASLGTELAVEIRGKRVPIRVCKTPFYRRPTPPRTTSNE